MAFVKCCLQDCKKAGTLEFSIAIPATGHPIVPANCITMTYGLATCAEHKDSIKVEDWITEHVKEAANKLAEGKAPPDFDRAFLEWMRLH